MVAWFHGFSERSAPEVSCWSAQKAVGVGVGVGVGVRVGFGVGFGVGIGVGMGADEAVGQARKPGRFVSFPPTVCVESSRCWKRGAQREYMARSDILILGPRSAITAWVTVLNWARRFVINAHTLGWGGGGVVMGGGGVVMGLITGKGSDADTQPERAAVMAVEGLLPANSVCE